MNLRAYIPEMLYPNVEELRQNYLKNNGWSQASLEFDLSLKEYVGTPYSCISLVELFV
jgi:tryptophan synthase beta chain